MSGEGPVVLAQLPRPLPGTAGETHLGACYGLKKSRKRKRFEVAAAIDGEALNIYDIQASKLVFSYAVSPTSSFTCAPCSVLQQPSKDSAPTRYTVCATQRPECQIRCFVERGERPEIAAISAYNYHIVEQSPVVYVDFVPAASNTGEPEPPPDVIAVHRNGTIRRVSGDLNVVRWVCGSVTPDPRTSRARQVVFAHCFDHADASRAVFRRRRDILTECTALGSSFIVLLYHNREPGVSGLRVDIFHIPKFSPTNVVSTNSDPRLRSLVSNSIPESKRLICDEDLQIHFQASSARLSISCKTELINYDLSTYVPEVRSKFVFTEHHSSLFSLGFRLAAGALPSEVQVYEVRYRSIRARYALNANVKRKRLEVSTPKPARFISYFSKIDTLVAVRGRNLMSFDISRGTTKERSRVWPRSMLVDSLGCNIFASEKVTNHPEPKLGPAFSKALFVPNNFEEKRWEEKQRRLNALVKDQRVEEFECMVAEELQSASAQDARAIHPTLNLPKGKRFVGYDKICYLLSRIFNVSTDPSNETVGVNEINPVVGFLPPRIFKWLAQHDYLSSCDIEKALSTEHPPRRPLKAAAVAYSIMKTDPSLNLLDDYLAGTSIPCSDDIVRVMKLLVREALSLGQPDSPSQQLLLECSHTILDEGSTGHAKEVEDHVTAFCGGWSSNLCTAMKRLFEKLHHISPSSISSAFRTHLDTDETLALVQFLRQQLFHFGYTSSSPSFEAASDGHTLSLEMMVRVLSSCIDALGPLGFLESTADEDFWHGLLPDLKAEISLALASIEESTYLKGVLQEMVKYGKSAKETDDSLTEGPERLLAGSNVDGETVETRYGKLLGGQDEGIIELPSLLPLWMKNEKVVSKTKRRKGGGELMKRSRRELEHLKRLNIGEYSFERLVL